MFPSLTWIPGAANPPPPTLHLAYGRAPPPLSLWGLQSVHCRSPLSPRPEQAMPSAISATWTVMSSVSLTGQPQWGLQSVCQSVAGKSGTRLYSTVLWCIYSTGILLQYRCISSTVVYLQYCGLRSQYCTYIKQFCDVLYFYLIVLWCSRSYPWNPFSEIYTIYTCQERKYVSLFASSGDDDENENFLNESDDNDDISNFCIYFLSTWWTPPGHSWVSLSLASHSICCCSPMASSLACGMVMEEESGRNGRVRSSRMVGRRWILQ